MNKGISWRQKYINLAEAIFRELGFPPPQMLYDEYQPLAMELNHCGKPFELIHSSTELSDRVLISCFLGQLPDEGILPGLKKILTANLALTRVHRPIYGFNSETQILKCMYYEKLDDVMACQVLEKMQQVAVETETWQEKFFYSALQSSENIFTKNQFSLA